VVFCGLWTVIKYIKVYVDFYRASSPYTAHFVPFTETVFKLYFYRFFQYKINVYVRFTATS